MSSTDPMAETHIRWHRDDFSSEFSLCGYADGWPLQVEFVRIPLATCLSCIAKLPYYTKLQEDGVHPNESLRIGEPADYSDIFCAEPLCQFSSEDPDILSLHKLSHLVE